VPRILCGIGVSRLTGRSSAGVKILITNKEINKDLLKYLLVKGPFSCFAASG